MDHVHTVHRSPKTERLDESLFTDDESEYDYSDMERLEFAEERICSRGQKRINSVREDVEQHGSERKRQKAIAKKQAVVDNRHLTGRGRPAAVSKTGVVPGSPLLQAGKKAVGALSGFVHGALEVLRTVAAYVGPRLSTFTWRLSWNRPKTPSFSQTPASSSVPAECEGVTWTADRSQQPQTASLSSPDSLPGSVSTPPTLASQCLPPTIPLSPATNFRLAVTCELQAEDSGQIVFQKTDNSVVYRTYDQMQKQFGQFRFSSGRGQTSFKVLADDLPALIKEMHDAAFASGSFSESIKMPEPRMSCLAVTVEDSEVGKRAESLRHVDASTQVDDGNSGPASPPALSAESSVVGSSGFPDDGANFTASQGSGRPRKRLRIGPATPSRAHYPRAAKERGEAARLRLIPPRRARAPPQNRRRRQLSEPPSSPPPAPFRTISSPMSVSQPS